MDKGECTIGEILADVLAHVAPSESLDWLEIDLTPEIDSCFDRWSKS